MSYAIVNGVSLYFERFGELADPVVVLIHGLSMPGIAWPERFVSKLTSAGFQVLRIDNRDIGKSSRMNMTRAHKLVIQSLKARLGCTVSAPYCLSDMAKDVLCLLDELSIQKAHLVGASMGGMIAQHLAAEFPARVLSLVSIMSSSGSPKLPSMRWSVSKAMLLAPSVNAGEKEQLQFDVDFWRSIGSPNYRISDIELHKFVKALRDWNGCVAGSSTRQLLAILKSGDRTSLLHRIIAPSLVIHGEDDPLVPVACGYHTAANIPDARLLVLQGMGHDLLDPLADVLGDKVAEHVHGIHEGNRNSLLKFERLGLI